ncbi:unnamed protein product, partial [Prorocentrum cordatum]
MAPTPDEDTRCGKSCGAQVSGWSRRRSRRSARGPPEVTGLFSTTTRSWRGRGSSTSSSSASSSTSSSSFSSSSSSSLPLQLMVVVVENRPIRKSMPTLTADLESGQIRCFVGSSARGEPGGRVLGLPGAELGRDRGPPQLRAAGAGDAGPPPRPGAPPGRQRRPARRAPGRGRRRHRASRSVTARGQIHRNLQWHVGRPRGRHRARWRRGRRTASYIILSSSSSSSSSSSCSHHWGGQVVWPRKTQARPAHNVQIVSDARHPRHYSPRSSASPAQARRQLSGHPGQK